MLKMILLAAAFVLVLLITVIISIATSKSKKLNKMAELIRELLPGLNCGQCGRQSCARFAVDISKGRTSVNECPYTVGTKNYKRIRQIAKKERRVMFDTVAFVKCKGGRDCQNKFDYHGDKTCASMDLVHSGNKTCSFACLGCGDCVQACVYGAISISEKGCAVVDPIKCTGCGECVFACPNKLISLIPSNKYVEVVCKNSSDDSLITRSCSVSCTHCEACVVACPYGAIQMVGNLPNIDMSKCRKCGKCVAACPNHVISRI